jgi:hypothetical protein
LKQLLVMLHTAHMPCLDKVSRMGMSNLMGITKQQVSADQHLLLQLTTTLGATTWSVNGYKWLVARHLQA